jgi:hypothetical protein
LRGVRMGLFRGCVMRGERECVCVSEE